MRQFLKSGLAIWLLACAQAGAEDAIMWDKAAPAKCPAVVAQKCPASAKTKPDPEMQRRLEQAQDEARTAKAALQMLRRQYGGESAASLDTIVRRSVYFDLRSKDINDESLPIIVENAMYLIAHKERRVVIQGNAHETGNVSYNLALGQQRAEAVRKLLTALGVADNQTEAVSFGREKPKALGDDEAARRENRRADIVHQ